MPTNRFLNYGGFDPQGVVNTAWGRVSQGYEDARQADRQRVAQAQLLGEENLQKLALENYLQSMGIKKEQELSDFFNTDEGHALMAQLTGGSTQGMTYHNLPFFIQAHDREVEGKRLDLQNRLGMAEALHRGGGVSFPYAPGDLTGKMSPIAKKYFETLGIALPQETDNGGVATTKPPQQTTSGGAFTRTAVPALGFAAGSRGMAKLLGPLISKIPGIGGKILGGAARLAGGFGGGLGGEKLMESAGPDLQTSFKEHPIASSFGSLIAAGGIPGLGGSTVMPPSATEQQLAGSLGRGIKSAWGNLTRKRGVLKYPPGTGTPPPPVNPEDFVKPTIKPSGFGESNVQPPAPNMQQVAPPPGSLGSTFTASTPPRIPSMGNVNPQGYTVEMYKTLEQMGYPPEVVNIMKPEQVVALFQQALGGFR